MVLTTESPAKLSDVFCHCVLSLIHAEGRVYILMRLLIVIETQGYLATQNKMMKNAS